MVARFFIFILTFVILKAGKTHKLIIDNDAGGDDAVAILLALLNEKYFNGPQLIGLTTVKGNTKESNVYVNNQRILKVADRQDIPIYRGSRESLLKELDSGVYFGSDGLGDCNEEFNLTVLTPAQGQNAVSALIELSKAHPGELSVLTIGPLTNLAMAIRLDPDFLGRLAQLYIGAGHIQSDDYPTSEFNARFDVEAYHIVLGSANPDKVTVLPFSQVGMHLNISKSWRQETLGSIDNNIVKAINKYEAVAIKKNDNWLDLDPAVVAVAIMQDLVAEYKFSKNKVGLLGDSRGIVLNEFADRNKANVRVAYVLKKENYVNFLMSVFSAETLNKM